MRSFVRQVSSFRNWETPDGSPGPTGTGGFKAEAGRYHLHVALICPWASRTLIGRALKGLEDAISVSVVEPELGKQGWRFPKGGDPVTGATYMHQIYTQADLSFTGGATVPVLFDKHTNMVVSNESAEILRMLNASFAELASGPDLYPQDLRAEIDALNERIYLRLRACLAKRAGVIVAQLGWCELVRSCQHESTISEQPDGRAVGPGPAASSRAGWRSPASLAHPPCH